jgi:nitroreductase
MFDLEQTIRKRHTSRMFLSKPVPRVLVDEALELAVLAPSNSNIQPWHVVFASGPPRDRLVAALLAEAKRRPPAIPPLPEEFRHYRSELGVEVYGAMGLPARTKRAMTLPSCATGSSSARRLSESSACTEPSAWRTPSAWGCSCKRCCWH